MNEKQRQSNCQVNEKQQQYLQNILTHSFCTANIATRDLKNVYRLKPEDLILVGNLPRGFAGTCSRLYSCF